MPAIDGWFLVPPQCIEHGAWKLEATPAASLVITYFSLHPLRLNEIETHHRTAEENEFPI